MFVLSKQLNNENMDDCPDDRTTYKRYSGTG